MTLELYSVISIIHIAWYKVTINTIIQKYNNYCTGTLLCENYICAQNMRDATLVTLKINIISKYYKCDIAQWHNFDSMVTL
jgi:hypothetical protein